MHSGSNDCLRIKNLKRYIIKSSEPSIEREEIERFTEEAKESERINKSNIITDNLNINCCC